MKRSAVQLFSIASATALEGLQQPIAFLLSLTCVVLTVFGPLAQLHVFGEEGRMARDSGLAFMLVFGLMLTGFTAGFTVSDEIRRGTASAVLAKPIGRGIFITGKWLGVSAVVLLFCATACISGMLAERTAEHTLHTAGFSGSVKDIYSGIGSAAAVAVSMIAAALLNYFGKIRFGLAASLAIPAGQVAALLLCGFIDRSGSWPGRYSLQVNPAIITASALIFLLLALYSAFATALATRLKTSATVSVCVVVLFLGFLADAIYSQNGSVPSALMYALIPDIQHFWMADSLANGGRIPLGYVARAAAYTFSYSALILSLGAVSLKSRDIA